MIAETLDGNTFTYLFGNISKTGEFVDYNVETRILAFGTNGEVFFYRWGQDENNAF